MSVNHYQSLQALSSQEPETLGVILPKLTHARISIHSVSCNVDKVINAVTELKPDQGWVMYSNTVKVSPSIPERTDMVEGEWCNHEETIKVKYLGGGNYLVTTMAVESTADATQAYSEQVVYLNDNIVEDITKNKVEQTENQEINSAIYRLWYQQEQAGDHQGRWLPLVQQFIGFDSVTGKKLAHQEVE